MKRILRNTLTLVLILSTTNSFSQQIDSMVVTPANTVGVNDTVKVLVYNSFSYGSCVGSANYSKNGFNINASALHCQGALTVICHDVDTIIIDPPHAIGNYVVSFVLSSGFGFPTCSPGIVPDDFDTTYFTTTSNAPPSVAKLNDDTICKNYGFGASINISDEDVSTVVVSATSDNQLVIANSNINLSGVGSSRYIQMMPNHNSLGSVNIKIVAEDNIGQRDSTSFNLIVDPCIGELGLSELLNSEMNIFPNPSNGDFIIEFQRNQKNVDIELFNMGGQNLNSWSFFDVNSIKMQLGHDPGLYLLRVSGSGQSSSNFILLK